MHPLLKTVHFTHEQLDFKNSVPYKLNPYQGQCCHSLKATNIKTLMTDGRSLWGSNDAGDLIDAAKPFTHLCPLLKLPLPSAAAAPLAFLSEPHPPLEHLSRSVSSPCQTGNQQNQGQRPPPDPSRLLTGTEEGGPLHLPLPSEPKSATVPTPFSGSDSPHGSPMGPHNKTSLRFLKELFCSQVSCPPSQTILAMLHGT